MIWIPDILLRFTREIIAAHGDHKGDHEASPEEIAEAALPAKPKLAFDKTGWLTSPDGSIVIRNFPTKRVTPLVGFPFQPSDPGPDGLVSHWTATGNGTIDGCAKRTMELPGEGERAASFHSGIGRDGHIAQCAPATRGTWNCGGATAARFVRPARGPRSSWSPASGGVSGNRIFYGLELEAVGEVRLINGKWYGWPFIDPQTKKPTGPVVPESDVVEYQDGSRNAVKHYQKITTDQEETYLAFLRAFIAAYPWNTVDSLAWTHARIDPTRKTDPGPIFSKITMPRLIAQAMAQPALVRGTL